MEAKTIKDFIDSIESESISLKQAEKVSDKINVLQKILYGPYKSENGSYSEIKLVDCEDDILQFEIHYGLQNMGDGRQVHNQQDVNLDINRLVAV